MSPAVCTLAGKRKRPTPAGDGDSQPAPQPVVDAATRQALRHTILDMLGSRTGTMCPSEAPRRLRPSDWRPLMEATRDEARALASQGVIEVTQRGLAVDHRKAWVGPVRLRLVKAP